MSSLWWRAIIVMFSGFSPFFISSAICLAIPARSSLTDENSWISTFESSLFACAVNCFDSPSIVFSNRSAPWVMTSRADDKMFSAER